MPLFQNFPAVIVVAKKCPTLPWPFLVAHLTSPYFLVFINLNHIQFVGDFITQLPECRSSHPQVITTFVVCADFFHHPEMVGLMVGLWPVVGKPLMIF